MMIKNISDALKEDFPILVSSGNRWLSWNERESQWVVRERLHRQHYARIIIETYDEEEAIAYLLNLEDTLE